MNREILKARIDAMVSKEKQAPRPFPDLLDYLAHQHNAVGVVGVDELPLIAAEIDAFS